MYDKDIKLAHTDLIHAGYTYMCCIAQPYASGEGWRLYESRKTNDCVVMRYYRGGNLMYVVTYYPAEYRDEAYKFMKDHGWRDRPHPR